MGKTILEIQSGDVLQRSTSVNNAKEFPQHRLMIGNKSKDAKSWINGPTHEIRNQCLPGYTGFIPGVKSENVFSTTYAQNTANSFAKTIPRGADGSPAERFKTVGFDKFSPRSNRRIVENNAHASRRDYIEYTIAVNSQMKDQRNDYLQNSQTRFASFDPADATVSPARFKKDLNGSLFSHVKDIQVRPRILQSHFGDSPKFQTLSAGFQRVFTEKEPQDENLRLPVVGYAGHTKGKKAENFYAKNFRDTVMFAESNLRK